MDFLDNLTDGKPEARDHPTCASAIFRSITVGNVTEWLRHKFVLLKKHYSYQPTYSEGNVIPILLDLTEGEQHDPV